MGPESKFRLNWSLDTVSERISAVGRSRTGRIAILLGIMVLGVLVRLDALYDYLAEPDKFFYLGEPLERSVDGYRTLTHARDLLTNNYEGQDLRRQVPEYSERPWPPMLMALLAAGLNQLTGISLNWIAGFLPVLLGPLIALPLYGLGRHYGGVAMGMSSSLLGTFATIYVVRSSFGWFDTDCLNVTLLLATIYFALRFGELAGSKRYFYLGAYALVTLAFVLWWWPIRGVAFGMSLVPLIMALIFHYRPPHREALIFFGLVSVFLMVSLLSLPIDLSQILDRVANLYKYIARTPTKGLPIAGEFNQEQMRLPFEVLADWSAGGIIGFALGWAGIAWLLFRHFRMALYLSALAVLSFMGTFYAARFLIFLSPFLSLGIGFVLAEAWQLRHRMALTVLLPFVVLPLVLWPQLRTVTRHPTVVYQPAQLVGALATTGRSLPEDAVIWAAWGNGNTIFYWSDRGTIADGDYHGVRLSIYNYFPLTVENDRLAANFMRFFIARGATGIGLWNRAHGGEAARAFTQLRRFLAGGPRWTRRLLAANPFADVGGLRSVDDWVEFLFPKTARPVYLLLPSSTATTLPSWWKLGTWDFATGAGDQADYWVFGGISLQPSTDNWKEKVVAYSDAFNNLKVDPYAGTVDFRGAQVTLTDLLFVHEDKTRIEHFPRSSGYTLEINGDTGIGGLMSSQVAASVLNRRFLRQRLSDYFVPVDLGLPYYQIWEVRADRS